MTFCFKGTDDVRRPMMHDDQLCTNFCFCIVLITDENWYDFANFVD